VRAAYAYTLCCHQCLNENTASDDLAVVLWLQLRNSKLLFKSNEIKKLIQQLKSHENPRQDCKNESRRKAGQEIIQSSIYGGLINLAIASLHSTEDKRKRWHLLKDSVLPISFNILLF